MATSIQLKLATKFTGSSPVPSPSGGKIRRIKEKLGWFNNEWLERKSYSIGK